jgi:hypothetical protein
MGVAGKAAGRMSADRMSARTLEEIVQESNAEHTALPPPIALNRASLSSSRERRASARPAERVKGDHSTAAAHPPADVRPVDDREAAVPKSGIEVNASAAAETAADEIHRVPRTALTAGRARSSRAAR